MSLDLNTNAAQLSQIEFGTVGGQSVLRSLTAIIPVTNFRETIGSQTTFAPNGSMNFDFILLNPSYQWIGGVSGGVSHGPFIPSLSWDLPVSPAITQAQFESLHDPLAVMLETYTPVHLAAMPAFTNGLVIDGRTSTMTFTVPTPPILPLLASGLLALGFTQARRRLRPLRLSGPW
jgi:hypothetical protein